MTPVVPLPIQQRPPGYYPPQQAQINIGYHSNSYNGPPAAFGMQPSTYASPLVFNPIPIPQQRPSSNTSAYMSFINKEREQSQALPTSQVPQPNSSQIASSMQWHGGYARQTKSKKPDSKEMKEERSVFGLN